MPRAGRKARNLVFPEMLAGAPMAFGQNPEPETPAADPLKDLLELLDTKVISASRNPERLANAPATVIVLSRSDLAKRGYTEVSQILDDLPGMQVVRPYGDAQVKNYWRGYRSFIGDPFLFMVDGIVQNSLYYNMVENTLVTVPISNIERIEVVYGPSSALYGPNAFMGVINVITRSDGESSGTLGAGSNGHRFADIAYQARSEDFRFSATFRFDNSVVDPGTAEDYEYTREHYLKDRTLWGVFVDNPNVAGRHWSQNLKRALDLRMGWRNLEVGYQYYDLRSGYGNEYAADVVQNAPLWHRRESSFHLKHTQAFSENFTGSTLLRHRESGIPGDSGFLDAGPYAAGGAWGAAFSWWQVGNTSISLFQDFSWKPAPSLQLAFGLKYEQRDLQKAYDNPYGIYQPAGSTAPYPYPAQPAPGPQIQNRITTEDRGLYAQARWFLDEDNSLILGGRSDHNSTYNSANTLRIGYVGKVKGIALKVLFGQAFQEPVPRVLYGSWKGAGSDPNLAPEKSDTFELSVGHTSARNSLTASYWRVKDRSLILASAGTSKNLGDRTLSGLDLHLRTQQILQGGGILSAWAYASFLLGNTGTNDPDPITRAVSTEGLTSDNKVGDLAEFQIRAGLTLDLRGHALTLLGRHVGARDTVSTNPVGSVPGHTVLDFSYHAPDLIQPGLGLTLKVSNLLDRHYFDPGISQGNAGTTPGRWSGGTWIGSGGYYSSLLAQPGREFQVALTMRF